MPTSALEWFTLLHTNRLVRLTFLNVFDSVNYVLVGLIYLGLYASLGGLVRMEDRRGVFPMNNRW